MSTAFSLWLMMAFSLWLRAVDRRLEMGQAWVACMAQVLHPLCNVIQKRRDHLQASCLTSKFNNFNKIRFNLRPGLTHHNPETPPMPNIPMRLSKVKQLFCT